MTSICGSTAPVMSKASAARRIDLPACGPEAIALVRLAAAADTDGEHALVELDELLDRFDRGPRGPPAAVPISSRRSSIRSSSAPTAPRSPARAASAQAGATAVHALAGLVTALDVGERSVAADERQQHVVGVVPLAVVDVDGRAVRRGAVRPPYEVAEVLVGPGRTRSPEARTGRTPTRRIGRSRPRAGRSVARSVHPALELTDAAAATSRRCLRHDASPRSARGSGDRPRVVAGAVGVGSPVRQPRSRLEAKEHQVGPARRLAPDQRRPGVHARSRRARRTRTPSRARGPRPGPCGAGGHTPPAVHPGPRSARDPG